MADPNFFDRLLAKGETWIRAISFGAYVLAAIGTFAYAIAIRKIGFTLHELLPYILWLIILGGVLWLLTWGVAHAKTAKLKDWQKTFITTTFLIFLVVVLLVIVGAFVLATLQYFGLIKVPDAAAAVVLPPEEFKVSSANAYWDEVNLPDSLFGRFKDDVGKPRAWMHSYEASAVQILESTDLVYYWLLTTESANTDYVAHTYARTADDIVIFAFLLESRNPGSTYAVSPIPLRQKDSENNEEYRFDVPKCDQPSRLLVFLAMKKATAIKREQSLKPFLVRSRQL